MSDIYSRPIDSINYSNSVLEINDDISMMLQQLECLLTTPPARVLGVQQFGIDLENYIFDLTFNTVAIESVIRNQIGLFLPLTTEYPVAVSINFYEGESRDLAEVNITISGAPALTVVF
jgi:hypothetical protein